MTDTNSPNASPVHNGYLRLPQVLDLIPVGKSTWWKGCKSGRFPQPIKLGPRTTAWKINDIHGLMKDFEGEC